MVRECRSTLKPDRAGASAVQTRSCAKPYDDLSFLFPLSIVSTLSLAQILALAFVAEKVLTP